MTKNIALETYCSVLTMLMMQDMRKTRIKAEELYNMAVEKGTPVLEKAADDVRKKTVEVLNKAIDAIEKPEPKKLAKNK